MIDKTQSKPYKVATNLGKRIAEGEFKAKGCLPSHAELCYQYNTSTRTIREALKRLEAKGLISISQGKNAEIRNASIDEVVDSMATRIMNSNESVGKILADLIKVRITLATNAAKAFALRSEKKQVIGDLRSCLSHMENNLTTMEAEGESANAEFMRNEDAFFSTLIHSSGNDILSLINDNLSFLIERNLLSFKFTPRALRRRSDTCTYLTDAMENGDADLSVSLARVALSSLLDKVYEVFPEERDRVITA